MEHWINILHYNINVNLDDSRYIIKCLDTWKEIYQNDYYNKIISKNPSIHFLIFEYLRILLNNKKVKKIKIWEKGYNNPFISVNDKEESLYLFGKTQKMYHILSRFVTLCKYKIAVVNVNTDLNLNKLTLVNNRCIEIFQNNSKYYFTISDLINIFNSSLTYSTHFFAESYTPKNPYTNEEFSLGILLKIYLAIRYSNFKIPLLIEMFHKSCYNISNFIKNYDYFIREEIIKNFIKNSSDQDKYECIKELLSLKCFKKIKISEGFPKKVLVKALNPYIYFYLMSSYSLRPSYKQWEYHITLKKTLLYFFKINFKFGRKLLIKNKDKTNYVVHYETDFKPVQEIKTPCFKDFVSNIIQSSSNIDYDSDSDIESVDSHS